MKPSFSSAIVLLGAIGIGCDSDYVAELGQPSVLTAVEVSAPVTDISVFPPDNTLQLRAVGVDQQGQVIVVAGGTTFTSSAPVVAQVDRTGYVRAVSPGMTVITASMTLGGITEAASVTITVHGDEEPPGTYPEIEGVYDLTAPITDFVWGVDPGTYYTAILTIQPSLGRRRFFGTVSKFLIIVPGGDTTTVGSESGSGFVYGTIDGEGRVGLYPVTEQFSSWYGEGVLSSRQIVGTFGCCDQISGTFTAVARRDHGVGAGSVATNAPSPLPVWVSRSTVGVQP